MKLRFTRRAVKDISDIASYVREHNPGSAVKVRAAIFEALQKLVSFPQLGRPQSVGSVRKLVTRRYRYLIYYMVDERLGEVVVLTVRHPARQASDPASE